MDTRLDDELSQRNLVQLPHVGRRIGLDVCIEQVSHIRFVRLDVEFLARVLLDGGADLAVELGFLLQGCRIGIGVSGFG